MNNMVSIALLFYGCFAFAQSRVKKSDSLKQEGNQYASAMNPVPVSDTNIVLNSEEDIKAKLIFLALNNAQAVAADANVRIAEIARRKANSSFLGSVNLGGNVNEFVVNNSPAANFFPKYNVGLTIPLDMFARNRAEKRTASEMITFSTSQKELVAEALKAKILIRYENYKEKKELLELERGTLDDDIATYEKAQKDYKGNIITIEDLNRIYRESITSKGNLASKVKDLNIAIIEIEEIIGVPLKTVLEKRQH
jgi:outer membrane protein TolC